MSAEENPDRAARRRRAKRRALEGQAPVPMPQKSMETAYGVVALYGAAALTLMFLIVIGDKQYFGALSEGRDFVRATIFYMGIACAVDGIIGFLLSRGYAWTRLATYAATAVSLIVVIASFSELIIFSPGFFITRVFILLMELFACLIVSRAKTREWLAAVSEWRKADEEEEEGE